MFGMEAAQEQIQSSLGNVKKPDFPEQSFYAEALNAEHCVEQKNEGMAPSNGPTEDNQKNLEKAETPTERKLDEIKAEADKMGEEHSNFNAFEEVENSLFTVAPDAAKGYSSDYYRMLGKREKDNHGKILEQERQRRKSITRKNAIYGAAAGTIVGALGGAGIASEHSHRFGSKKKALAAGATGGAVAGALYGGLLGHTAGNIGARHGALKRMGKASVGHYQYGKKVPYWY